MLQQKPAATQTFVEEFERSGPETFTDIREKILKLLLKCLELKTHQSQLSDFFLVFNEVNVI